MNGMLIGFLRVLLAVLFLGCIGVQLAAAALAGSVASGAPAVVLTALLVAAGLCVEAVILSVWMLVGMVRNGSIFDGRRRADLWVNVAIGALGVAAVLCAGCFVYFLVDQAMSLSADLPALTVTTAASAGVAAALALLVAVMRRLLHTAIQYQSDLAEVI